MLIDTTYFGGTGLVPCIPNVDPNDITQQGSYTLLNNYIGQCEPEACEYLMGSVLYNALIAGLVVALPEARWTAMAAELRNSAALTSPLANYTWMQLYQMNNPELPDGVGEILTGFNTISPKQAAKIWNQAVKQFYDFQTWLQTNIATYPEYDAVGVHIFGTKDCVNFMDI